jgi:hypothetical protein
VAKYRWIGAGLTARQVNRLTVGGTWAGGEQITLSIDNIDFVIVVGSSTTAAQVAELIYQAYAGVQLTDATATATVPWGDGGAKSIAQFSEFTASNPSSGVVDLTANGAGALAGKPMTLTVVESSSGGTITHTNPLIAPTSPYHANQPDNYSPNGTPGNGDELIFDSGSVDVRWNLNLGVSLSRITKYKSSTGNVGLPETNRDNGSLPYHEHRAPTYLTCGGCTVADLEVGEGTGSGRFMLDTGAGQSTINVFGKGAEAETGIPCILWKGTHAANVVNNLAGSLGIAFYGGEQATVATLISGDGKQSQAKTICGSGCTLGSVTLNGGSLETNSAVTTAVQNGGIWVHKSGTINALTVEGGTFKNNGGAAINGLTIGPGGHFDLSSGTASCTIGGTIQLYAGARFSDPQGRSGSVSFKLNGCTLEDVTIELPRSKTYTVS